MSEEYGDWEDGSDRAFLVGHHTERECRHERDFRAEERAHFQALGLAEEYELLEEAKGRRALPPAPTVAQIEERKRHRQLPPAEGDAA